MLPFGHIAAGYLTAELLIEVAKPALSINQLHELLWFGALIGFVPDLDMFYAFWRAKSFQHSGQDFNHREFISHAPLLWLFIAILIIVFAPNLFVRYLGLLVWLGTWSHFLLDSGSFGVRWLYPFSKRFYALKSPGVKHVNPATTFFAHWWHSLKSYYQENRLAFYVEILLVVTALIVYIW
jgi:hypothetical protein